MTTSSSILCPVDFSNGSAEALRAAASLASERGCVLHVLYAYRTPASIQPSLLVWMATGMRPLFEVAEEQANRELDEFVSRVLPSGKTRPTCHVVHDEAVSAILKFASEQAPTLIVLGTHGRTGFTRFLMGSVAEAVVRRATRPVLTVREKSPRKERETMRPPVWSAYPDRAATDH
jgi:universal stress protein A